MQLHYQSVQLQCCITQRKKDATGLECVNILTIVLLLDAYCFFSDPTRYCKPVFSKPTLMWRESSLSSVAEFSLILASQFFLSSVVYTWGS